MGETDKTVGLALNPADPGKVVAIMPACDAWPVATWPDVMRLLEGGRLLAVDPKNAEQIVRILNGNL